jgi:ribosomal protein S18 acetylase RimI-like enzyme
MIRYRTFRNDDPPGLTAIWNAAGLGRGAATPISPGLFDRDILAKPYFDPPGLIVAEDNETPIGFAHAGFGPNEDETEIDTRAGVLCAVLVRPEYRRRGIGSELLRRAEQYLREEGATQLTAGCAPPANPFYFGLYGGSDIRGILDSDKAAEPFLRRHGYQSLPPTVVLARRLGEKPITGDSRWADLRQRYEVQFVSLAAIPSWWQDCRLGMIEPAEFRLVDRIGNQTTAARIIAWEMASFEPKWNAPTVGILDMVVRSDVRRRGLGRFLLGIMLRTIEEQRFAAIEAHCEESNAAGLGLLHGLGFVQVDRGRTYRKSG